MARSVQRNIGGSLNLDSGSLTSANNLGITGNAACSTEVWIKIPLKSFSATFSGITSIGSDATSLGTFALGMNNGTQGALDIEYAGSHEMHTAAGALLPNTWYHIVIVHTPGAFESNTTAYINGVKQTLTNSSTGTPNLVSSKFVLGVFAGLTPSHCLFGLARAYNIALTASQVDDLYRLNRKPATGCVVEYLFTEGSGTSVADTSGNANTGTSTVSTWSTDSPFKSRSATSSRSAVSSRVAQSMRQGQVMFHFDASKLVGKTGDPVSTLPDLETGNFTVTATGSARPTIRTNAYNGLTCLAFDGTAQNLFAASSTAINNALQAGNSGLTTFVVAKHDPTANLGAFWSKYGGATSFWGPICYLSRVDATTANLTQYASDGALVTTSTAHGGTNVANVAKVFAATYQDWGTTLNRPTFQFFINGVAETVTFGTNSGNGDFFGNGTNFGVGCIFKTNGLTLDTTSLLKGDLCEIITFYGVMSAVQIANINAQLQAKWGV